MPGCWHAVIDLGQQHHGPVASRTHVLLGLLASAGQARLHNRMLQRRPKQHLEILANGLYDIVHGPGLQRGHGDRQFRGGRHVDDRGRRGMGRQLGEHVEPGRRPEVVVEDDDIDPASLGTRQARLGGLDMLDEVVVAREHALHEPPQRGVVVDIEDVDRPVRHQRWPRKPVMAFPEPG